MTDREMLELAAKAYGFGADSGGFIWTCSEYPRGTNKSGALWNYKGWRETAELWNPLTDDGDALRLAVKLGLIVCVMNGVHFTGIYISSESPCGKYDEVEHHRECSLAATRRAIVRAAAQIGAQM